MTAGGTVDVRNRVSEFEAKIVPCVFRKPAVTSIASPRLALIDSANPRGFGGSASRSAPPGVGTVRREDLGAGARQRASLLKSRYQKSIFNCISAADGRR
jgi:hypothetical protein